MQHFQPINSSSHTLGFTIVEAVVTMVILSIIIPVFGVILNDAYRSAFNLNGRLQATGQMQQALDYMNDTARNASAYLATIPAPYTDAYGANNQGTGSGNAWSYKGNSTTDRVLITASYATTTTALNTGRQPVFENTPDFNCTSQMYYQPELQFITIYFVHQTTLYRRILTDTSTPLCPGNAQAQKQSCPPYLTPPLDVSCKANDEILATDVTNFTVAYYQIATAGSSTVIDPTYSSTDPTILSAADYAIVTISETTNHGSQNSTVTQRLTKVNQS